MCECISIEICRYSLNTHFIICTNVLVTFCNIRDGEKYKNSIWFYLPCCRKKKNIQQYDDIWELYQKQKPIWPYYFSWSFYNYVLVQCFRLLLWRIQKAKTSWFRSCNPLIHAWQGLSLYNRNHKYRKPVA